MNRIFARAFRSEMLGDHDQSRRCGGSLALPASAAGGEWVVGFGVLPAMADFAALVLCVAAEAAG
jgi:hypothetical protein